MKSLLDEMRSIPLFRDLGGRELEQLGRSIERRTLDGGESLLEEGLENRYLFCLVSGRLRVWRRSDAAELVLAEVGPGEVLGEMSVLESGTAVANVTALEPSVVLGLEGRVLERLIGAEPATAARLYHRLALLLKERLKGANRLVAAYHGLQETLLEIESIKEGMEPPL